MNIINQFWKAAYDEESKENIERLKGFVLQTKSKELEQLRDLLVRTSDWLDQHVQVPPCDGTIICQASHHASKCYAYSATDRQWRNQMNRVLNNAR